MTVTRFVITLAAAGLLTGVFSSGLVAEESVAERLKPVGATCMEGQPCAAAVVAAASGPRTGEQVYAAKCTLCHGSGLMGAPKTGDAAAWGARLAERKLEGLLEHAIKGFNAMPAKGTCADCSDDEIKNAIKHMLDKSK